MSNPLGPSEGEPEAAESRIDARDRLGRERAVDPRHNVALEASAGTGKTRVLVDRYVNLLKAGVDPSHVLAITFTRKASAEMRERIVATLRAAAASGEIAPSRWNALRDRTADIGISTIDAFCLSLLREFPLEADLDPGFSMADETEVPRLVDESLDRALRICRHLAREDDNIALVFAQLGERKARAGLATLLSRRIVAPQVLSDYLAKGPRDLNVDGVSRAAAGRLLDEFAAMPGGLEGFLACGPPEPLFALLARALRQLSAAMEGGGAVSPVAVQSTFTRVREYFLTQEGEPRRARLVHTQAKFRSKADWQAHRDLVVARGPGVKEALLRHARDLNVLVARGISRMFQVAQTEYRRTLDAHAVLDFSDVLLYALSLLRRMEEFSQSRYRLESRYHHLLVDEFQDTSRAQWELVSLLVRSWGEGVGLAHEGPLAPSVFIVGDRKQSIYGFRDADVSVLHEASRHIDALRPDGDVRRSISRSFRSTPALLGFVNDVCHDMEKAPERRDAFVYAEQDRFPNETPPADWDEGLGAVLADTPEACAEMTGDEIARLLASGTTVRDRETGLPRGVRSGDVAILFRTRESHRAFEAALDARGIPSYVYKGLGFFDTDEIKDALVLLGYLADPVSDLRAAALLRSRFVRISDEGLRRLAPRLADALRAATPPTQAVPLNDLDAAALSAARAATRRWRGLVDRLPPAELFDRVLTEAEYAVHLRGPRVQQARENLKKMRSLLRRIQNRGYVTLGRIAMHLDRLAVGDEANASIDALDAVKLMTVHAAKGLEFPVVFLVNLGRGTGNSRGPIRVTADPDGESPSVSVGDFQSDADEDDARREREETKRLLYVALTRARDRLYLASALKDGRLQPGRGSLAEVLPKSLVALLVGGDSPTIEWHASSGVTHRLRLCQRASVVASPVAARADENADQATDYAPMPMRTPRHRSQATTVAGEIGTGAVAAGTPSDRLVGTLVHRLLARVGFGAGVDATRDAVSRLIRPAESLDASPDVIEAAIEAYRALAARDDVRAMFAAGRALHEVPFTMEIDGAWIRGTIDCVVCAEDRVTVLEFKTGRTRPEHREQVELYRRAASQMFPGRVTEARLVYAGEAPPV